jgi:DNA repair protein RecO (recombination protein O)
MEWTDDGIVLGTRRHGESSAILELMTREHGRHLGLVRGGSGSRMRPVLQPGNLVRVTWRARLDEHLGYYAVDGLNLRAGALLATSYAVYALTHLAALTRFLPERDPHEAVFETLDYILDHLDAPLETAASIVRFELAMLSELGFGLDLEACAATGTEEDLAYVSPKSGRAVSRVAGAPWQDRLLQFPAFLVAPDPTAPSATELKEAFVLTGFFLERRVTEPRGQTLPDARAHFIAAVLRTSSAGQIDRSTTTHSEALRSRHK